MQQRDIILQQIEQLTKVLAHITSKFLDLNSAGFIAETVDQTSDELNTEIDLDLEALISMDETQLASYFKKLNWTEGLIEDLSALLCSMADAMAKNEARRVSRFYKTAIDLLYLASDMGETFSIQRMEKITGIKKKLSELPAFEQWNKTSGN